MQKKHIKAKNDPDIKKNSKRNKPGYMKQNFQHTYDYTQQYTRTTRKARQVYVVDFFTGTEEVGEVIISTRGPLLKITAYILDPSHYLMRHPCCEGVFSGHNYGGGILVGCYECNHGKR